MQPTASTRVQAAILFYISHLYFTLLRNFGAAASSNAFLSPPTQKPPYAILCATHKHKTPVSSSTFFNHLSAPTLCPIPCSAIAAFFRHRNNASLLLITNPLNHAPSSYHKWQILRAHLHASYPAQPPTPSLFQYQTLPTVTIHVSLSWINLRPTPALPTSPPPFRNPQPILSAPFENFGSVSMKTKMENVRQSLT